MVAADRCVKCGESVSLISAMLDEDPVSARQGGELCPACYRSLSPEEYQHYLGGK